MFRRMPEEVAKNVSEGVYGLYTHCAGGRVRFVTGSPYVVIQTEYIPRKMPHFAFSGSAGFDMYATNEEGNRYMGTFMPPLDVTDGYESVIDFAECGEREITINLPLYSSVKKLCIGLKDSCVLKEAPEYVREFFVEMKRKIPDLMIENCAAGGHRLEPSMIGVTALSSFSDAHEAIEIPYIAANLHNLMLPAQSLIWAVLHKDEALERTVYSLAATFLGRVCISGQVDELRKEQYEVLRESIAYYKKLEDVIKNGASKIYGNRGKSTRYPTGTQVVVRKTDKEMLVVCHAFEQPGEKVVLDIPDGWDIKDSFHADKIRVEDGRLVIEKMNARTAQSVLLGNRQGVKNDVVE